MVRYDEKLLYEFADGLYAQARRLVWSAVLSWGLLAAIAGYVVHSLQPQVTVVHVVVLALLAASVGYAQAQTKAFQLRLEGQRLLVWAQIEANTRRGG